MTRERVVIDTNVLISGLVSTTSTPPLAVEKAITKAQLVRFSSHVGLTFLVEVSNRRFSGNETAFERSLRRSFVPTSVPIGPDCARGLRSVGLC